MYRSRLDNGHHPKILFHRLHPTGGQYTSEDILNSKIFHPTGGQYTSEDILNFQDDDFLSVERIDDLFGLNVTFFPLRDARVWSYLVREEDLGNVTIEAMKNGSRKIPNQRWFPDNMRCHFMNHTVIGGQMAYFNLIV